MPKASIELTDEEMKSIDFLKKLKRYTARDVLCRSLKFYGLIDPPKNTRQPRKRAAIMVSDGPTTPNQCPSCGALLKSQL